jgi:hypothetical protein
MTFTIKVGDRYYQHCWSGKPLADAQRDQTWLALYCYAIGDDLYRTTLEEAKANSEVVDYVKEGSKVSKLYIVDGRVT